MGIGVAGAMTTTIAIATADVMTAMIGAAVVTLVIAIAVAEHRLRGKKPFRQKCASVVSRSDTTNAGRLILSARGDSKWCSFCCQAPCACGGGRILTFYMRLAAIQAAWFYIIFCCLPHGSFHEWRFMNAPLGSS